MALDDVSALRLDHREHHLCGSAEKASAVNAGVWGLLPCQSRSVTDTPAFNWLSDSTSGVVQSALGLVGTVSAYCKWVRQQVSSSSSRSSDANSSFLDEGGSAS